jgi:hypothetical protein
MIKIIRQICQKAGCQPKDLVVEWTPSNGARLVGTNSRGERIYLNVVCRLEHIAHAIYLCANGQEHLYPQVQKQQEAIEAKLKEWLAENVEKKEQSPEEQTTCHEVPNTRENLARDWRHFNTVPEIMRAFPIHPTADDMIDLYQRNKKLNSVRLRDFLEKHSRSTIRGR